MDSFVSIVEMKCYKVSCTSCPFNLVRHRLKIIFRHIEDTSVCGIYCLGNDNVELWGRVDPMILKELWLNGVCFTRNLPCQECPFYNAKGNMVAPYRSSVRPMVGFCSFNREMIQGLF